MVAPYIIGQAVRSSVRIPGSGTDRQASPVLLDLSNVSPLVSSFQISLPLQRLRFRPYLSRPTPQADQPYQRKIESPCDQITSMNNVPKDISTNARSETNANRKRHHPDNGGEEMHKPSSPLTAKRERREANGTSQTPVQAKTAFTPNLYHPKQILLVQTTQTQQTQVQQAQITMVPVPIIYSASNGVLNRGSTNLLPSIVYTENAQRTNAMNLQTGSAQNAFTMNLQNVDRTLPQDEQNKTPLTVSICSGKPNSSVLEMSQEICELKRKNIFLCQRLKTFQNIFKSKERLQCIANCLALTL